MKGADNIGQLRRFIFEGIATAVPIESLMQAFELSELEVRQHAQFTLRKIREYQFQRLRQGSPHARFVVACDAVVEIQQHRSNLLETLRKLGDQYLSTDLLIPKISIHKMEKADDMRDVARRVNQ